MSAIRGIPTTYKGIRFRSRAEACWAVLFDKLDWTWDYEPIDLDGYVPDFLVKTVYGPQLLVEVKGHVVGIHPLLEHTDKIANSSWTGPALVVGAFPCSIGHGAYYVLGKYARPERIDRAPEWDWQDAEAFYCLACKRVSFIKSNESPGCQMCAASAEMPMMQKAANLIAIAWSEAKNRVQWRPS